MAKVIDSVGSDDRTTSTIDLELDAPKSVQAKIKRDVGEFIVSEILSSVNGAKSPVAGESWPGLSKGYKKIKVGQGGTSTPDMQLSGSMLDSLKFKATTDGVEVGFFNKEAAKADGHNKLSGRENNTPQRRFLPEEGQDFIASIQKGIEEIVADAVVESEKMVKADFEGVETKSDLMRVLSEKFDGMSRTEITAAVLRSVELTELLDDLNLLELLDG